MEVKKIVKLFTKEQARQFLNQNNLKNAVSKGDALVAQFMDMLQEALEADSEPTWCIFWRVCNKIFIKMEDNQE